MDDQKNFDAVYPGMIHKVIIRNFKSIQEQTYEFSNFDLLVGGNNSGKSTVLQALAIWQFCVDEFSHSRRTGSKGIQVVLPNFTALPVPEFNLLWRNKTDRWYEKIEGGKPRQNFYLIQIEVFWRDAEGQELTFGVDIRYHSPQTVYAIPQGTWTKFKEMEKDLPKIAYVPPFSGLDPVEEHFDDAALKQRVGKAQPGSILRNLLLRVFNLNPEREHSKERKANYGADWLELEEAISRWFRVNLGPPVYDPQRNVNVVIEYNQGKEKYDIIAGGSGFHQTLTLLAFLYGRKQTTILLDEPDAHLHVKLQREILDFFKQKARERGVQFLIATHAEEFVKGVAVSQIVSLLSGDPVRPTRVDDTMAAMSILSNEEIVELQQSQAIVYIEGEDDERILRAWASILDKRDVIRKITFRTMGGGSKETMKNFASNHFKAIQQIVPNAKRLIVFDYDQREGVFHPAPDNPSYFEWSRKNIENYLLVPPVWERFVKDNFGDPTLFSSNPLQTVKNFFSSQNLTLPPGGDWRGLTANIFSVVDGKDLLFASENSLYSQLLHPPKLNPSRERIAETMSADELHEDVYRLFAQLETLIS